MSKIRDFFIKVPAICGADNAETWGMMNQLAFDHEVATPGSVFGRKPDVSVRERLLPAFGFMIAKGVNKDVARYAQDLAILAALSYGVSKGVDDFGEVKALSDALSGQEPNFPQVSELLTVSEASTLGNWV
jgi:hypothetical protein